MSNLNDLTAQEVYDIVKSHLLAQGKPSFDRDQDCAYRGSGDTSCAVGCLIPEDQYTLRMEGLSVDQLCVNQTRFTLAPSLVEFLSAHQKLLTDLQMVHDAKDASLWPSSLTEVAIEHGLIP